MIQVPTSKDEHEGKYTVHWQSTFCFLMLAFVKIPNYILLMCYIYKNYKWTCLTVFLFFSICYRRTLDRCLEGMVFVTFQLYILICLQLAIKQNIFIFILN